MMSRAIFTANFLTLFPPKPACVGDHRVLMQIQGCFGWPGVWAGKGIGELESEHIVNVGGTEGQGMNHVSRS